MLLLAHWSGVGLTQINAQGIAQNADPQTLFGQANQLYQEEKFGDALKVYQQIEELGLSSSDFHYNIGNAYYKNQELGHAIFHYEKGLRLSPKNQDLKTNLDFARQEIEFKADTYPLIFYKKWLKNIIDTFGSKIWFALAIILSWLTLWIAYKFLFDKKRSLFFSGFAALLCSLIFLIFALTKYNWENRNDLAIILSEIEQIKTAPSADSQTQFKLSAGNKVDIVEVFDDWAKIELDDGKEGWIKMAALRRI